MAAAAPWEDVLLALAPDAPEEVVELPVPVLVLVPDPDPVSVPVVAPVLATEPVVDAPVPLTAV
jgi:hypothetical protein